MTFLHPGCCWALLAPALLLARAARARRRQLRTAAAGAARRGRTRGDGVSLYDTVAAAPAPLRIPWRGALGLALVVGALARPQWGTEPRPSYNSTQEIILAVDISHSMAAGDIAPTRLAQAKKIAASLLDQLADQRVGLIVFARVAILQSPLSVDHDAIRDFLPELTVATGPAGGTDFRPLLALARTAFSTEAGGNRHLVILSDGEAHGDEWKAELGALRDEGIVTVCLGIGTASGATLDGGNGPLRDRDGAVVVSRLESPGLEQLAAATGGAYADASGDFAAGPAVRAILAHGALQRRGSAAESIPRDRYPWFLAPALLLLAWSLWREFPIPVRAVWAGRTLATAPAAALAGAAAGAVLLALALGSSRDARAQEDLSDVMGTQLNALVGLLALHHPRQASDYAILASTSLNYGHWRRSEHHPIAPGIIADALAAVAEGRRLDARAADWARLESSLRDLELATPPQKSPPPPPARSLAHPPPLSPENEALLRKLQRIRANDSAVHLYELLHPPAPADAADALPNW